MVEAGGEEGRGLFAGHRQLCNFLFIAALGLNFNDRFFLCIQRVDRDWDRAPVSV